LVRGYGRCNVTASTPRLHPTLATATARISERSSSTRARYLARVASAARAKELRSAIGCANLAHAFAACHADDKARLREDYGPNLAIVTAYNDMLSAHKPYESYPERIRAAARRVGASAQVAGGVPAMCDGVTQGRAGMEFSLFSRDVIALATAIALSHEVYDAALYLGICDKIVPGLLIGALTFGHLPAIFVPAGPMTSGLSNFEKVKIRQRATEGLASRAELLQAEEQSYHGAGTCTFYGTANSNQMLVEIMGLHLPGASFVNPGTPLRDALTDAAVSRVVGITERRGNWLPIAHVVDERAIVNAAVGLHATGGSTNHLLHLIAIARAAGIILTLDDIAGLADAVPLLARIYPNGAADVNRFHAAGGMRVLIAELLTAGLLHADVNTVMGVGLARYCDEPQLEQGGVRWSRTFCATRDPDVLRPLSQPFLSGGALRVLSGNLGTGAMKLSVVPADRHIIEAPALVLDDPSELKLLFKAGVLERDFVAVVRFQGPRANGMPEMHSLMPVLGALQDRGHRVALVTDGRLSGASGKVPAVIHVTPEASDAGPLARVCNGDLIRLDAPANSFEVLIGATEFAARTPAQRRCATDHMTNVQQLFGLFRNAVGDALNGASVFGDAS
jgi:phosphogluconate dehydratase